MSSRNSPTASVENKQEGSVAPRERIVSCAAELFRKFGIRGIGVDAIAEAAHTNKMTLYRKFRSKDDLLCETLRQVTQRAMIFWTELDQGDQKDAAAKLNSWVDFHVQRLEQEPGGCDLANAVVELRDIAHPAYAVVQEFKTEQRDRLAALCTAAGATDPNLLADTLSLLLEGARVNRQATGADGSSRRLRESCNATIKAFAPS